MTTGITDLRKQLNVQGSVNRIRGTPKCTLPVKRIVLMIRVTPEWSPTFTYNGSLQPNVYRALGYGIAC